MPDWRPSQVGLVSSTLLLSASLPPGLLECCNAYVPHVNLALNGQLRKIFRSALDPSTPRGF